MLRHRLALRPRHALALGLLQGPTELLPVSSSAHTILIPLLAGWPYGELEAPLRKSFEVALHAGTALALALDMRAELARETARLDARRALVAALACAPAACAGVAFERYIEQRMSEPAAAVRGLVAGALAMALADMRPARRRREDVGPRDGLLLGIAQAAALAPGVSRNGATLAAARALGFRRADAQALSWHAGLPVMVGAGALKAARIARGGLTPGAAVPFATGAIAAFASTLVCARGLGRGAAARPLLPFVLYRLALAGGARRRLARGAAPRVTREGPLAA
jgi:undecaprenyl-diphosphatase